MKKKVVSFLVIVVLAVCALITINFNESKTVRLSLSNAEALARGESTGDITFRCCPNKSGKCTIDSEKKGPTITCTVEW